VVTARKSSTPTFPYSAKKQRQHQSKKKEAAPAGRDSGSPVVGSPAVHSLWLGTVQFGKPGSVQAATPAARRRENIFFLSILKTAIVKK
jgi:hypothetical protein